MKKVLAAVLVLIFIAGACSLAKNTDEENITMIINANASLLLSGHETGEPVSDSKTDITTLMWYREKGDSLTYDYNITVNGDTAVAEITVGFPGIFNQMYLNDSLDTIWIEKEFTDTLVRYARFLKDTVRDYFGGWRFCDLTDAVVKTSGTPVSIDSVKLYSDGIIDTVIDDIYGYFCRDDILVLPAGSSIQLSVYPEDTSTTFFVHSNLRRAKFTNNGAFFTGTWNVPMTAGNYRCIFDGITTETFNSDSTEYSSMSWVIPYKAE